jgi:hypothetical protein
MIKTPHMKGNVGQCSEYCQKDLMMGRAQDTGKPAKLKENKVPKFRHWSHSSQTKKKATAALAMALNLVANQGFEPRTCGL